MSTSRVRQEKAVGSGVVVIRQPAVDAQGVLRTIQILPSELPSVQAGRSPPLFVFKQKKNRTLSTGPPRGVGGGGSHGHLRRVIASVVLGACRVFTPHVVVVTEG